VLGKPRRRRQQGAQARARHRVGRAHSRCYRRLDAARGTGLVV